VSRILFHTPHQTVAVTGAERAWMIGMLDSTYKILGQGNSIGKYLNELTTKQPELKLIARLHSQCELHCYVESDDRNWLAGLITEALDRGLLRKTIYLEDRGPVPTGWLDVLELLHDGKDTPVVLSYSVSEEFPSLSLVRRYQTWEPTIPTWNPEEEWYDLPYQTQWQTAMAALRQKNDEGSWLRLQPGDWNTFYYAEEKKE
jgi:hypothetical protein